MRKILRLTVTIDVLKLYAFFLPEQDTSRLTVTIDVLK